MRRTVSGGMGEDMSSGLKPKIIKDIKVDVDKCTGCRACEMACSAFHAVPKYSSINPSKVSFQVNGLGGAKLVRAEKMDQFGVIPIDQGVYFLNAQFS